MRIIIPYMELLKADLNALLVFAKVIDAGSFSEAARRLAMPLSTVSRKISELETQLGVQLMERTTRALRLTEIGVTVLKQARAGVEIAEAVQFAVSNQQEEIKGQLQLSAPPNIAESFLASAITSFQEMYPAVRICVIVSHRSMDLIPEGVDIALRVGDLKDSSLIALPVLKYRHLLVAGPHYLETRGQPRTPQDLLTHRLIAFSYWNEKYTWNFNKGKMKESVSFNPNIAMNDYAGIVSAVANNSGIGELPPILVQPLLESGHLVEVLPEWTFAPVQLSLLHSSHRYFSHTMRLFRNHIIEYAKKRFPDLPT